MSSAGPVRSGKPLTAADVVIVDFNAAERVNRLLESLRGELVGRIIVVDNSTSGSTRRALHEVDFDIELIEAVHNGGFGSGVNLGMRWVRSEFVVVSNPDVVVSAGAVETLVQSLEADPHLALVGPAVHEADGSLHQTARAFPTVRASALQAFAGLLAPSGRIASRYREQNWARSPADGYVDWVSGAFFVVRREAFEAIDGFDEEYFMYVEEVDLCWRLKRAGYRVAYVPAARVTHVGGVSSRTRPYAMAISHHRSLYRFARNTSTRFDRLLLPVVGGGLVVRLTLKLLQTARARERSPDLGKMRFDELSSSRVGAVIVTYYPDLERLGPVLEAAAQQVDSVIVIDNGSELTEIEACARHYPNVSVVGLGSNRGIAAALNAGVRRLSHVEPAWILTLDQDTVIDSGSVEKLLNDFRGLPPELRSTVAILAMARHGRRTPSTRVSRWIESACEATSNGPWRQVSFVITSGNLVRAEVFEEITYNEDFFMDQVDTAFCADVRRRGLKVLENVEPTMEHQLGRTVETKRGPKIYEPASRLYYISRNSLRLVLRRDLPVRLYLRDLFGLVRVHIELDDARSLAQCLRAVASGVADCLRGRFGPNPHDACRDSKA